MDKVAIHPRQEIAKSRREDEELSGLRVHLPVLLFVLFLFSLNGLFTLYVVTRY